MLVRVVPSDTSSAAQAHLDAHYRRMSPAAKVKRLLGLTELTHALAATAVQADCPTEDARGVRLRVVARTWDRELLASYLAWREARR